MEKSCTALLAIVKHIENYSFYKTSLSPLTDAIRYCRTDASVNSGEAAGGFKSNNILETSDTMADIIRDQLALLALYSPANDKLIFKV